MIKTFAYNEFNFDSYRTDINKVFKEIEDFIHTGGNLNHPVKDNNKFIPAISFLEQEFGEDFVKKLLNKKYLDSPGDWKFNEQSKTIEESKIYHTYWYRDNYHKYSDIISEGFRNVCKKYITNPIYSVYEYKDELSSNPIKRIENCNPLISIILRMPFKNMINVFLEEIPNAKELLNEYLYKNKKVFEVIIGKTKDDIDILISLFKYQIVDFQTIIENYNFYEVIKKAIYENDFKFINILKKQSSNPHYIGELDDKYSFFRYVNSIEMAKILIDCGCKVIRKNDQYNSFLFSPENFPIHKLEIMKFIMDYVPFDYTKEYENVFWNYLEKTNNLEQFKKFTQFIVSKGFPLEKYDLFEVCPGYSWEEKIKTCLELGANPNKCQKLIHRLVNHRDISSFKFIQKNKLLNLYSPDAIYYLLNVENHTKGTLDLLDKADINNINAITSFGVPAWFGANNKDKFNKIFKKINSFNQLDSQGNNWLTHYYSQDIKNKHNIASIVLEMAALENIKNHRLLSFTCNKNQENLLHYAFQLDFKNPELKEEFITIIKSFDISNLNELFNSLDQNGLFPIDKLIASKSNDYLINKNFWDEKLHSLLKICEFNFDYDLKNKDGKTLYEQLKFYYSISNDNNKILKFIEPIENAYSKYKLYNKLDKKLVTDNKKTTKIKI